MFGISWLDLCFAKRGAATPVKWRARALAKWAALLDSVIFLDAQNRTLAGRIRTRAKRHRMMHGSDMAIRRFANGFRAAFEKVIAELGISGHLVVDELRTDGRLDRSAARLQATLARHRYGH